MLGRIRGAVRGLRVDQAAPVARALTALVGELPDLELLPGGPPQVSRAVLTARWLATSEAVPWPSAVMRQLDPDDPAFLPALGMHPVLAARDITHLGLPGRRRRAWVDSLGWTGLGVGPSVAVWFGSDTEAYPVGRAPRESYADAPAVLQQRSDEGVGVRTWMIRDGLEVVLMHWPVVLGGEVAWAIHARLTNTRETTVRGRLGYAIRPSCVEGAAPIFGLVRDSDGLWSADGRPILSIARGDGEVYLGRHGEFDPWLRFAGVRPGEPQKSGAAEVRCRYGRASALEVASCELAPGGSLTSLAVLAPPRGVSAALVRTSGEVLWSGATADRRGMMSAGSEVVLSRHQPAFDAARSRLLLEPSEQGVPAFLSAVALVRMGFVRRAEDRLAAYWSQVRRDGSLDGSPEDASALAWATAEVVRWSGGTAWARGRLREWTRLLDHLIHCEPTAGGRGLFGVDGSVRWTAIWRAAGLLASSASLRELAPERRSVWALEGGRQREALPDLLGAAPWSASPGRAFDGSSAAMLAGSWLGVVDTEQAGVVQTARALKARHWHGGGVLHQGGAHGAATALLAGVVSRIEPATDWIGVVAALASGTGAIPTARHPSRGALGEGDDLLAAALFGLLVLDQIRVTRGRLILLPGIRSVRDLPTPLGRVDIDRLPDGGLRVQGRWRGPSPEVIALDPEASVD